MAGAAGIGIVALLELLKDSKNRTDNMQQIYEKIVLDGSNIIHDDTGIVMKNSNGERLSQIRPERLLAAINHCESLGWTAVACLKEGTYTWAKSNPEAETVGDVDLLDELIQDGKVITIPAKEDDIYFIDYALKVNAMIVTHDSFKDKKDEDGNVIKEKEVFIQTEIGKTSTKGLLEISGLLMTNLFYLV